MGALVINDILSHLPADTLCGAVSMAGTPCVTPDLAAAFNPLLTPIRAGLFSPDAIMTEHANITLNRLLFLRDPSPSAQFLGDTICALETSADFTADNPAVSWETRMKALGSSLLTTSSHRQLVASRTHNPEKTIEGGRNGFPVLLLLGTCDPFTYPGKLLDGMMGIFRNMQVQRIQDGSHALFLDAPSEVMQTILTFARQLQ
jgi:pimeloyl-ACP methyl ester carboxylesterase